MPAQAASHFLTQCVFCFFAEDVGLLPARLFARVDVPPLAPEDVAVLKAASALNWSAIDPTIFGTLFERGLDPAKRSQLGANFTDPATILRLVEPVVQRPLLAEWAGHRGRIEAALAKSRKHGDKAWRDVKKRRPCTRRLLAMS